MILVSILPSFLYFLALLFIDLLDLHVGDRMMAFHHSALLKWGLIAEWLLPFYPLIFITMPVARITPLAFKPILWHCHAKPQKHGIFSAISDFLELGIIGISHKPHNYPIPPYMSIRL